MGIKPLPTLLLIIPFVGWLIEPIMILASDDGRKLSDKGANTQVIDKKKLLKLKKYELFTL